MSGTQVTEGRVVETGLGQARAAESPEAGVAEAEIPRSRATEGEGLRSRGADGEIRDTPASPFDDNRRTPPRAAPRGRAAGGLSPTSGAGAQGAVDEAVIMARAYLSRVAEPPAPALVAFVAEVGPVEAAERVRRGAVSEEVAAETSTRRDTERAAADLDAAGEAGAWLLVPEHEAWPHWAFTAFGLAGAALASPLALWVRGRAGPLAACTESAVSIVGARAATGYGTHVAGELGAGLARSGFTVVSGAALGIDGSAHRGALAVEGSTVAVLACGIDRAYPSAHTALLERIAAQGLVVSEYPPASVPARHRFLVRNRLIAALGAATVVVEAGRRSGAHRTAADALALGKPVMAVPGPVTSAMSAGCHELIRAGAELVTCVEDVLELAGRMGEHLARRRERTEERPTDGLDPVVALVHDALPARGARPATWLAKEAGVPIGAVRAALAELARRELAVEVEGRWQRP